MLHIIRPKRLFFCMAVLLAIGVSCTQMQRAQASPLTSTQASSLASAQAPALIAKKNDPIAIVYHRCRFHPATATSPATCPNIEHRFFVHNGMALANLRANEPATKMGHVSRWIGGKPQPQTWFICSHARVLSFIRGNPAAQKTPCHADTVNGATLYWVRDLTKTTYKSPVTIGNQSIPVKKVPIAYRVGNGDGLAHDAVFVCYRQPASSTNCKTNIPTSFTGTLFFEHYLNPKGRTPAQAQRAETEGAFKLVPDAHKTGNIRVVNLRTLTYPAPT